MVWFLHTQMCLVQHVSKDKWAKYEPVLITLADSTAVARQVKTPIFWKLSTLKTACLALTSGPQPPQGTGKHVAKPDLAQPAPYKLGTAYFMWPSRHVNHAFWFTPSLPQHGKPSVNQNAWFLFLWSTPPPQNGVDDGLWHASDA